MTGGHMTGGHMTGGHMTRDRKGGANTKGMQVGSEDPRD
jgi:hypothetical protein